MCGAMCIMTNGYFTDISCLYFLHVGLRKVEGRGGVKSMLLETEIEGESGGWKEMVRG